ncbi:hypothetical protein [Arthrobacter glacialis]|uniref:YtxH domain-containing protein n=1 Tax=Arthrobacter glacialis TaxID=1664 RepID=A0A2S3ZTQ1_ARTGL|nr:hypothetical protein [Arthrobacter glacialis]POH57835.1 hypothetical protein CVS28_13775 [Arthrobacter glacialis]POH72635.1 hypothetical protein CVS27_14780 [Arthrobacter glacialis]
MKGKLIFTAGVLTGYILGSRAGRTSYENLKKSVKSLWAKDSVQDVVTGVEHQLKNVADEFGHKVKDTIASSAAHQDGPSLATTPTLPDVTSDPALNDKVGQDWADEGGAAPAK